MTTMNASQRKYAIERADAIASRKVREVTDKYTTPEKSESELLDAFRKGRVPICSAPKVRRNSGWSTAYTYLSDVFDLSSFSSKRDDKTIEKEVKKIEGAVSRIRDQIMLGDAVEALNLLRDFDN